MRNRLPMICSITALLVAVLGITPLGEAAYDAVVPRGSVGTAQLKRNAVTSSKLAPNTVRTGQVVDNSLLTSDFKPGQIPQGPKGDKGDKGDRGPVGISGYEVVVLTGTVAGNSSTTLQPRCPVGKKLLGGAATVQGSGFSGVFFNAAVTSSGQGTLDTYTVLAANTNATSRNLTTRAICAKVAS